MDLTDYQSCSENRRVTDFRCSFSSVVTAIVLMGKASKCSLSFRFVLAGILLVFFGHRNHFDGKQTLEKNEPTIRPRAASFELNIVESLPADSGSTL